ncbi:MAG: hypothetical protein GY953_54880 [bacterium]|nr:hypothetical protein [bacterium]
MTLAAVTPETPKIAGKLLDKDYPDPEAIEREIAALETRLRQDATQSRLARRLENLRRWLKSPVAPSPARLERLAGKLGRAVRRAILDEWRRRLDAELRTGLAGLLEMDQAPEWLLEPRQREVIEPLLGLSGATRELGLRLLRLRCGPPPWNLHDESENQGFLNRLRRLRVNPEPWINPPPPMDRTGKNGRAVRLSFETDPLEIFHMGGHFETCLSPGNFNFFSVFANAADVNKHVVYARDRRGQVVGRCLLAICESGRLLTFEAYCHDRKLGFREMVGELADNLARRMNTMTDRSGRVPCLVASNWYDDGPRDLCQRFAFLAEDSEFRRSLATMPRDDLAPRLEQLLAPLPLNAMTLPLIIELEELVDRPALVLSLIPHMEAGHSLPEGSWIRAALLAHKAGEGGFSHRVLRDRAVPYLMRMHRRHHWLDTSTLEALVELDPSTALRVLRRTRPMGVRADEQEGRPERRKLLTKAHEALGRAGRARRLREAK